MLCLLRPRFIIRTGRSGGSFWPSLRCQYSPMQPASAAFGASPGRKNPSPALRRRIMKRGLTRFAVDQNVLVENVRRTCFRLQSYSPSTVSSQIRSCIFNFVKAYCVFDQVVAWTAWVTFEAEKWTSRRLRSRVRLASFELNPSVVESSYPQSSIPIIFRSTPLSVAPPAKSSNAFSVTRMMWFWMKGAPSAAPSSGCFRQHSHSSTAHES